MSDFPPDSVCACKTCVACCTYKPGWFAPGEVEKVAEHLEISVQKLFNEHLAVDWWEDYPENVYVFAPAVTHSSAGREMPKNPYGRCVFLKDDRCSIHEVKPIECRKSSCRDQEPGISLHSMVKALWVTAEAHNQVRALLGREPVTPNHDEEE